MTLQSVHHRVAAAFLTLLVALSLVAPAGAPATSGPDAGTAVAETGRGVRVLVAGTLEGVTAAVRSAGGSVLGHLPLVGAVVAEVPEQEVGAVGQAPGVRAVVEDDTVELQGVPHEEGHPADTAAPATLGADKVWQAGHDGAGVGIAVVDTGVDEVGDLAGRVVGGIDLTPEQDGRDNHGHGTLVAAAAIGNGAGSGGAWTGVAPGAHVVPVKIAGADGHTTISRLLIGLDWIARNHEQHDIRVVNLSLGSTPAAVDLVDAAVQRLWDLGLVVVVAAGNNGPDSLGTPAANTHVITVGASQGQGTKRTTDDVAAPWSSTGVDVDGNQKPDVTAPGQSIVLAGAPGSWAHDNHPAGHLGDGYQRVSGTSFSAGLISGAAALALDAHPDWTPDEVLGQLVTEANGVDGTHAPSPWLPKALRTEDPSTWNDDASAANLGATVPDMAPLAELGPPDPLALADATGDLLTATTHGVGWYGVGWYGVGWYATDWFGVGWYGVGWYGQDLYGVGWYATDWYGVGWYGVGWYGVGWYGVGWY